MNGYMRTIEIDDIGYVENINKMSTFLITKLSKTRPEIIPAYNIGDVITRLLCEINNQYAMMGYHLIFDTQENDKEYANELFKYLYAFIFKTDISYLAFFINEELDTYSVIPHFRRLMRKKQTGDDSTESSVSLMNSNSPINMTPEVTNPTSKSSSGSHSKVSYNNVTEYDNVSGTEMANYYARLESLIGWIRKNWFDPLIYEFQVNNY